MDPKNLLTSENKIVVGIDFGTTCSGVAWAEIRRPDRIETVTAWPVSDAIRGGKGELESSSDEVPTRLRYVGKGEVQWGFGIPVTAPPGEIVEWFKL